MTEATWASGQRVGELGLDRYGVTLVALLHEGKRISSPDADVTLCVSDTLILSGAPTALDQAEMGLITRIGAPS